MSECTSVDVKALCHDLRNVKAALEAGFAYLQSPTEGEKAKSLCDQGLQRLDNILDELQSSLDACEDQGEVQ
ncbi:MAG: hypothetical protein EA369_09530 [Bradymonadales bacterium]|nr:MAG: hypothetical protein EA369_09530 [Bradymonadales bacterium]